jgi:hypothetical protein
MESTQTADAEASEAVDAILSLVGLETCLFTARTFGDRCAIRVDYVTDSGWRSATICLGNEQLCASLSNPSLQRRLAESWQERLADARAIKPVQAGRRFAVSRARQRRGELATAG